MQNLDINYFASLSELLLLLFCALYTIETLFSSSSSSSLYRSIIYFFRLCLLKNIFINITRNKERDEGWSFFHNYHHFFFNSTLPRIFSFVYLMSVLLLFNSIHFIPKSSLFIIIFVTIPWNCFIFLSKKLTLYPHSTYIIALTSPNGFSP